MLPKEEIINILNHAGGTAAYHRFSVMPAFPVITDGALDLAEAAECYWLLDIIGSYQRNPKLDKSFQVWTLEVDRDNASGIVRGFNDETLIITQYIPYTDFPLDEIRFYLIGGVLLLPSEY